MIRIEFGKLTAEFDNPMDAVVVLKWIATAPEGTVYINKPNSEPPSISEGPFSIGAHVVPPSDIKSVIRPPRREESEELRNIPKSQLEIIKRKDERRLEFLAALWNHKDSPQGVSSGLLKDELGLSSLQALMGISRGLVLVLIENRIDPRAVFIPPAKGLKEHGYWMVREKILVAVELLRKRLGMDKMVGENGKEMVTVKITGVEEKEEPDFSYKEDVLKFLAVLNNHSSTNGMVMGSTLMKECGYTDLKEFNTLLRKVGEVIVYMQYQIVEILSSPPKGVSGVWKVGPRLPAFWGEINKMEGSDPIFLKTEK